MQKFFFQQQIPLLLPCYDFNTIIIFTFELIGIKILKKSI